MDFTNAGPPNGSTFDPENVRLFSLLPDEDTDEAYCVRHDSEMTEVKVVVFYQRAEYELAPRFHAFTCESCAMEASQRKGAEPVELLRAFGQQSFEAWNDGEALGEWFEFVQERADAPESDESRVNILRLDSGE